VADERDRMAAILIARIPPSRHGQLCPVWTQRKWPAKKKRGGCNCWQVEDSYGLADYLIASGFVLAQPVPAALMDPLLIAARDVLDQAEADDDFDGQFIDYLVPHDAIASLRAAYEPWSAPTATTAEEQA
jgi:hypothetical protein